MAKAKQPSPLATNPQYQKIRALICVRRARCLWQVDGPEMHSQGGSRRSVLEAWAIPGCTDKETSIFLVHVYPDSGIDLFVNGTPHDWEKIATFLGPTEEEEIARARAQRDLTARDAIGGDS